MYPGNDFSFHENKQISLLDIIITMPLEIMLIFWLALAMCYAFAAKYSQQIRVDYGIALEVEAKNIP